MALTWEQVLAWRLRRQLLDPRADTDAVAVVRAWHLAPAAAGRGRRLPVAARRHPLLGATRLAARLRGEPGRPGRDSAGGEPGVPAPEQAARTVIPAYLAVYGPATPATFDQWLTRGNSRRSQLRGWFAGLGAQLVTVQVDGQQAYALAADLDELQATRPTTVVRLLPGFDQYLLGPGTGDPRILDPARRRLVSRTAGWISPVVVAGGRVAGVWELDGDTVAVRLFEAAGTLPRAALQAEAAHLGGFLGRALTVAVTVS